MASLPSARNYNLRQRRIAAGAVNASRNAAKRGSKAVADSIRVYQAASINLALETAPTIIAAQGLDPTPVAEPIRETLLTPAPDLASMVAKTETPAAVDRLTSTFVLDAARTAMLVGSATRPSVTGYVRQLTPPSCSRCAILAGRVYRHSTGFQRHPGCDCTMTPTNGHVGRSLITSPEEAFRSGTVTGLSKADTAAVNAGADLGRVVNVRRSGAGLSIGGSVLVRAGRLTPEGCMRLASTPEEGITLLTRYGYIK